MTRRPRYIPGLYVINALWARRRAKVCFVRTYSVHAVRKSDVFRTLRSAPSAPQDQQLTAVLAERFFEQSKSRPSKK
jgi:hypothetical protein